MSETTKVSTFTIAITAFSDWLRHWTTKSSPLDPQGRRMEQALPAYPTEEQLIYLGKGEGEYEFQKSIPIYESRLSPVKKGNY